MINRKKQLKSEYIADELRRMIHNNGFPGGRLPRKSELVQFFHISQTTIESALKMLTSEGLIHGVKGTGIFINETPPDDINLTHRIVVTVMRLKGDYYGSFFENLREELLDQNLYPLNYQLNDSLRRLGNLANILSAPIKGVIYHGLSYWRFPFLDQRQNLKSVAMEWFDAEGNPPGGAVFTDYEWGGYELARHFLENGRRKLLFLWPVNLPEIPQSREFWQHHPSTQMKKGIGQAIREYGAQPLQEIQIDNNAPKADLDRIIRMHFDGFICFSDGIARHLIQLAETYGLQCPRDFFVSGCLNTPGGRQFPIPITSLDPDSITLSRTAVEMLNAGCSDIVTVKPRIIWRNSTEPF